MIARPGVTCCVLVPRGAMTCWLSTDTPGIGKAAWSIRHTDRYTGMIDGLTTNICGLQTAHDRPHDTATALSHARSITWETCAGSGKTWLLVLADDATVTEFLRERRVPETRGGSDSVVHTDHIVFPPC